MQGEHSVKTLHFPLNGGTQRRAREKSEEMKTNILSNRQPVAFGLKFSLIWMYYYLKYW